MGRLDDQAKKRIVELRKAGLSFRKIKKVLELDNIRVTPQAVYLFLKRKNVELAQPPGASHLQPAGGRGSRRTAINLAGWEDEQLWNLLQENETEQNKQAEPRGSRQPDPRPPALPRTATMSCKEPHLNDNQDCKDSIKIISVTSLCKDSEQFGKVPAVPMGPSPVAQLSPINSDSCSGIQTSAVGSHPAPLSPATAQQQLNSRGRMFLPPARNPALIVKKKIVDRAIHLQKKATIHNGHRPSDSTTVLPFLVGVQPASQPPRANPSVMAASMSHSAHVKDASTQTALLNPTCPSGNQNPVWGGQMLAPSPSPHAIAEKLDAVHTQVQKLSHVMHAVLESQCRMERQQEQQQRFQQEVLMMLQQLRSTVSHGTVPGNEPCVPFSSMADPLPTVPNFSQFKMELI
ncbi:uncharacterized protein LOC119862968 [Dermochelys coriacea]|uniref:uncharacterized protein LOC119862968 n=1 Tax=Dermochelys coriacea TaxID=27794 RepID=UPI0018E7CACB|nr:uncharacterized protein LOC119862968 [Dermochelys coriacea]XP_038276474.1 uncharacterized protein LOC119862968 [Dermochelys coriacea]XP_038276478.1 uncharacterized protein LOC119862968 [Dermochelys coriacea]XP_038276483.1 uncharacterized protein LOC119862968 [Dermochelys coriacea]XP_043350257.1 uncharacterized protein LOC119862968 [Dermochelys coriacea]XP_043350259.1 uncharacterized protein LOC119862968 [Dermochelys coriacea]XP_043350260.1 uncharacterized protein LOC119862968 [Dermochelys 